MANDGRIPRGLLLEGKPAIRNALREFELALSLDKENEKRPKPKPKWEEVKAPSDYSNGIVNYRYENLMQNCDWKHFEKHFL